jgi:hypothetical protein
MARGSLEVLLTKSDVTRKPSLARGPVANILRLSFPLLDNKNNNEYQTPKQYCDHSDLAGETNTHKLKQLSYLSIIVTAVTSRVTGCG